MDKRTIYTLMTAFAFSLFSDIAIAGTTQERTTIPNLPIKIVTKKGDKNLRPKMPSRQQISCWYDGESLTFDFAIPEGECTLTVTDAFTAMQEQYTFDTETIAEVYIGPVTEVYLELYTSSGHTYEGRLGE